MRKVHLFRDARRLQDLAARTTTLAVISRPKFRARLDIGPHEKPSEFDNRLHNWYRAHRWIKSSDTNHTFPAYRYCRSPIGVEAEYETGEPPPHARLDPIDWEDAWELELAWRDLARKAHWVLKLHIHGIKHPKHSCRLLRQLNPPLFVQHEDWETAVKRARAELELKLNMRQLVRIPYLHSHRVSAAAD